MLKWRSEGRVPDIEVALKRISLLVSVISVALMLGGLAASFWYQGFSAWPGESVVPLSGFLSDRRRFGGPVLAMSAGIVLLALLPALRVLIAFGIYARARKNVEIVIALIVLLELLASMLGMAA